ncbi:MAG: porin family protein [Bacteroidota bacterium]
MKKLLFIMFSFVSILHSQFAIDYGIKIGGTVSNQNWNYTPISPVQNFDPDNKFGFNGGIFVELPAFPFFTVVTELNYVQKGVQKEVEQSSTEYPDGTGEMVTWKLGINYLNFSLLGKAGINLGVVKPYLLVGPRLDYELNKSVDYDNASFYDEFKKSRLGLKLGLGSEFNLINLRFLAEVIYDLDLSELYKNENVEVTSGSFDFRVGIFL